MNIDEFQVRGKEMIEYICEYLRTLEGKRVTANVDPGYLRPLLPKEAPAKGESWDAIIRDVDRKIMPGVSVDYVDSIIDPPLLIPTSFDVNNIREYEKNRRKKTHDRDNGYTYFYPLSFYLFYIISFMIILKSV